MIVPKVLANQSPRTTNQLRYLECSCLNCWPILCNACAVQWNSVCSTCATQWMFVIILQLFSILKFCYYCYNYSGIIIASLMKCKLMLRVSTCIVYAYFAKVTLFSVWKEQLADSLWTVHATVCMCNKCVLAYK